MNKVSLLVLILFVLIIVSTFGSHFGFSVNGVPQNPDQDFSLTKGMSYFYNMTTFQIDGMPAVMSAVFLFIVLLSIYIIVSTVLPGGG